MLKLIFSISEVRSMDAITYLRGEHSKFRKTLKQIDVMKDEIKKQKKFAAFCLDLKNHEKMEEKTWYPKLKKDKELSNIIKHLIAEEKKAAKAIREFKKMEYGFVWKLKFKKFKHDVDHHATQEEKDLFPKVRKKLTKKELNTLGTKMRKFKIQLNKK